MVYEELLVRLSAASGDSLVGGLVIFVLPEFHSYIRGIDEGSLLEVF